MSGTNNSINNLGVSGGFGSINQQTGDYSIVLGDADNVLIEINKATSATVTIPTNASVAIPLNRVITIVQTGAGQVTISPAGGVTLNSPGGVNKTALQYSVIQLTKRGTNTWLLSGDATT